MWGAACLVLQLPSMAAPSTLLAPTVNAAFWVQAGGREGTSKAGQVPESRATRCRPCP